MKRFVDPAANICRTYKREPGKIYPSKNAVEYEVNNCSDVTRNSDGEFSSPTLTAWYVDRFFTNNGPWKK